MRRNSVLRVGLLSLVMCGLMFVAGCRKVSGTYSGANDLGMQMSINFKSSDKADFTVMGSTQEVGYQVDGNKVTVHGSPDVVLTINDDGSLQAGVMKLTKK